MANDHADEFGFSSGDEADLIVAEESSKRQREEDNNDVLPRKRIRYPLTSALAVKILKENFNLPGFRLEQEAVISRLLNGGNAVVVFPTGAGKSICYQVGLRWNPLLR